MTDIVLNDLYDYGLKIYQHPKLFKFSLDSLLLAEFVKLNTKTKNILDLCSGNASIPLILTTKTTALIDGIEIQKTIYDLAIKSIKYNNLEKQITFFNGNALEINSFVGNKKYDIITCNPPFFKVSNKDYTNNLEDLAIARHEIKINLEDIFNIASRHLNTRGEFYLVHRLERLDEIILLGDKYNLRVKNIEMIKTTKDNKPSIVLVRCLKNGALGLKINDVKNIENLNTYQNIFKEGV